MAVRSLLLMPRRRSGAAAAYLLKDEFTTDEGAPVASPRTAEPGPGTLTLIQTHASMSISSGVLEIPVVALAAPGDGSTSNVRGGSISRTAGRMFLIDVRRDADDGANWTHPIFGFFTATPPSNANNEGALALFAGKVRAKASAGTPATIVADYTTTTMHEYALVLRANGIHFLMKIGGDWKLLFVEGSGATATLYPGLIARSERAGETSGTDNWRIPTTLWTPTPLASDSFNRSDNDSLGNTDGAGAEESGGDGLSWIEANGDWEISSNKLRRAAAGGLQEYAVFDAGENACLIRTQLTGNGTQVDSGLILRDDGTDYWLIAAKSGAADNWIRIYEFDGATFTQRASATVTIGDGDTIDLIGVSDGNTITGYLNDGNRVTYGSASRNNTATRFGLRDNDTAQSVFHFVAVWARTQSVPEV